MSAKKSDATLPAPTHASKPDLESQPLDLDEPTYCLCNQVSFVEMIGCDNKKVQQLHLREEYLYFLHYYNQN